MLTGHEIHLQVASGRITILPFSLENLGPNSYDVHLSDELLEMAKEPVWTVGVSYTRDGTFSMWDIIESVNENGIHFGYSDEYVEWWNYGLKNTDGNLLGWLAYRRKPQEV